MSNFSFLAADWSILAELGKQAEAYVVSDPVASLTKQRMFIETLVKTLFTLEKLPLEDQFELSQKIKDLEKLGVIERELGYLFTAVRRAGNEAVHGNHGTKEIAFVNLKKVLVLANWFMETYGPLDFEPIEFNPAYLRQPTAGQASLEVAKALQAQKEKLEQEMQVSLRAQEEKFQEQLRLLQKQLSQKTEAELQAERVDRRQRPKRSLSNLSELETRVLFVDEQLRQAGWEVDTEELDWRKGARPEKNKNKAIAEVVLPNGDRADYGLFIGLDLVGIVEAKKYGTPISSHLEQAKDYAKSLQESPEYNLLDLPGAYKVPFIFATNGRPYFKQLEDQSGIWFWDARNTKNLSYALEAWHSPEDLKQKLMVNEAVANEALKREEFPDFANRYYQIDAVKAVEDSLRANKRRLLLAMATGTGKTRLALSLMYRLIKTKRVRRILFLVDRRSLGIQAADALKDTKIDNTSFASLYDVKEVTEQYPEETTRIHIATVQGMVRRLFGQVDDRPLITPGTYDFIIVDESHRGYTEDKELSDEELLFQDEQDYVSQYRRVIDYFDATVLGLTATPALHTTQIFGQPIYTYSYQQAVIDGYLVDHEPPYKFETELSKNGIHFEGGQEIDVWNEADKTVDKALLEDELDFEVEEFNKKVISEGFNRAIAEKLTEYIDPDQSQKTLIFAATDKHADSIVHLLKEAYTKNDKPVDDDAIMKITGVVKDVDQKIKRFKNEQYPTIVVTVDLLTTGIDVPQIEHLVFLRRVKSRILYDQMLGRATRLCPANQKESFKIYDAVHLYDALENLTDMRPVVSSPSQSIGQVLDKAIETDDIKAFFFFQRELMAKLQRKKQRLGQEAIKDFQTAHGIADIDQWLMDLKSMSQDELKQEAEKIEQLATYYDGNNSTVISHVEDRVIEVTRGYGPGNKKPGDYLSDFEAFIKDNVEKIEVLNLVVTRPKDLTYKDLQQIQLLLKEKSFDEKSLQAAWRQDKQEEVLADIISFIRQVALGERLVDHEIKVKSAMRKVYGMSDWTPSQRKWLERIEKQLLQSSVLAPTAKEYFDSVNVWKQQGGYKRIVRELEEIDKVIDVINTHLYQV